jgi:hypothetical protein
MATDYKAIRKENERRYGTDIGRIGPILLSERYADRTHFIFELLQNAEDALGKRAGWNGNRTVRFHLKKEEMLVSHYGKPFDEADVRGICGIGESTKELTTIGRFGIGFKSVYAFTDRPEVHAGDEDFAIENFVWPVAISPAQRHPEETLFVIPFRDPQGCDEVIVGLQRLGVKTLLFLREIEEIEWVVDGGPSGIYLRSKPDELAEGVRRVVIIGQQSNRSEVEENWLIFSKPVETTVGLRVGYVEIAFFIERDDKTPSEQIVPLTTSPLVVFFPTVVETHLGFLVQGPYRTTPSRDNVPHRDSWNQGLIKHTGTLLVDALRWLRDKDLLDTGVLNCLPIDRAKFSERTMFAPFFEITKQVLMEEPLLPRHDSGYVEGRQAKLARSQELRKLLSPEQLATFLDIDGTLSWISGDISQDRTPDLRTYLIEELDIEELRPETILPKLDVTFLEAQSDEWICSLYEFLNGQKSLIKRANDLPLIRLTDGRHVCAYVNSLAQAFLPSDFETDFPTVRPTVCNTEESMAFLQVLGLQEPDPVDDVIRNVLLKYKSEEMEITDKTYEADVRRIMVAFRTDSKTQREKLVASLRETPFVRAADAGNGDRKMAKPGEMYLAAERLKALFDSVAGVLFIDDTLAYLRGEDVRELLEACGTTRYLQPIPASTDIPWKQRHEIRLKAGLERASWELPIKDVTLRGLNELLNILPNLEQEERRKRAALLWEGLADVESRRGSRTFLAEYTWGYFHETKTTILDAAFVRLLNEVEWIPDANGNLQRPEFILFDFLGWRPHPFLQSKIHFKPPVIDQLAKEAGIEPGVLELLKKIGLTSEADLRVRLGIGDKDEVGKEGGKTGTVEDALRLLGITGQPPQPGPAGVDHSTAGGNGSASLPGSRTGSPGAGSISDEQERQSASSSGGGGHRTSVGIGARPFISYVGAHPDEEEPDPDGLDKHQRMALEARAIDFILSREPNWQRTPTHNPGFDLFKIGPDGQPMQWCEVKAMAVSLEDRPVGLSRTQFKCAREHGEDYWLYVVEYAGDEHARIVRIQDPAGKARTFTFDRGWVSIAQVDERKDGIGE